jgi:hypothetical protein
MAKVKTQRARKDYPEQGIKKGDTYFSWKLSIKSPLRRSLSRPKPSQLTMSDFWQEVYSIKEQAEATVPEFDGIESDIEDIKSQIENHRDEQDSRKSNMPDNLQEGPTGELLQGRYDALDECVDTLGGIDATGEFVEATGDELEEAKANRADEIWSEVIDALEQISCE